MKTAKIISITGLVCLLVIPLTMLLFFDDTLTLERYRVIFAIQRIALFMQLPAVAANVMIVRKKEKGWKVIGWIGIGASILAFLAYSSVLVMDGMKQH